MSSPPVEPPKAVPAGDQCACGAAILIVRMRGDRPMEACEPEGRWVIHDGRRILVSVPHICEVTA